MKADDFEKNLKEYCKAHPELREALKPRGDGTLPDVTQEEAVQEFEGFDELPLNPVWKEEIESHSTPEQKERARNIALNAIAKVQEKRKRRSTIRGIALAAAAVIVLFFAVTPSGQSLARGLINTIVSIFDNTIRIETTGIESVPSQIKEVEPREFKDITEAAKYINRPLVYVNDSDVQLDSVSVDYPGGMYVLCSRYTVLPDKRIFVVFQTIFEENGDTTIEIAFDEDYFELELFNGQTMYCVSHSDGTYGGAASWDNVMLSISSETIGWDELERYVNNFTYTE